MKKRIKKLTAGIAIICTALNTPATSMITHAALFPISGGFKDVKIPEWKDEIEDEIEDTIDENEGNQNTGFYGEEYNEETSTEQADIEETDTKETNIEEVTIEETSIEEITTEEYSSGFYDEQNSGETSVSSKAVIKYSITNNGEFDYKTYIQAQKNPLLKLSLEGMERRLTNNTNSDDLNKIIYKIKISDRGVINVVETENVKLIDNDIIYATNTSDIELQVKCVGVAHVSIEVVNMEEVIPVQFDIAVKNSSLSNDDFYVELETYDLNKKNNSVITESFTYDEWCDYLDIHNNWINGEIKFVLSENGKEYFTQITNQKCNINETDKEIKKYTIWAENPSRNASTYDVENGTRCFNAEIDIKEPIITSLTTESKYFEPTSTDTKQYFSQDFVLNGEICDTQSGIKKLEYTTDYTPGDDTKWTEINTDNEKFRITLSDGCYNAIALRAHDYAGNISEIKKFTNKKGEFIQVIVDKSEPVINVEAISNGTAYDGSNDIWTNSDVIYDISFDQSSCEYAGIYQYEYIYEKIGDYINKTEPDKISGEWIPIKCDDRVSQILDIKEDKNGYYYFQAISNAGVKTKIPVKSRILIQHQPTQARPIILKNADTSKCKNGWFNKNSGIPEIHFEYPNYDTGVISKEYDAPITIHYTVTLETEEGIIVPITSDSTENNASIGVLNSEKISVNEEGIKEFILTKTNLDEHIVTFKQDKSDNSVQDGIYTLEYWITDSAGNSSQKQKTTYKIDSHEPTELTAFVNDMQLDVNSDEHIVYEKFYNNKVLASADAKYGISKKGKIEVLKASKIGDWKSAPDNAFINGESFEIAANTRCFLYIRAQDNAGNIAEGWTKGIITDNMTPNQISGKSLIVEPEGANEHGFFNSDVKVKISIKDSPESDKCSSLSTVKSTICKEGKDIIKDRELFSFTKECPTESELIKAAAYESMHVINARENESNETYIKVTATDRSGNTKTSKQFLKIDITKPKIDINFDSENPVNGSFYNRARTAFIHIHEINFDKSEVDVFITKDGTPADMTLSEWRDDGADHYASIVFKDDGDYSMSVSCTDLADNKSEIEVADNFTIDTTQPKVDIELIPEENTSVTNDYYNSKVTAVIKVEEHNFNEEDFYISTLPTQLKGSKWSHTDDTHTMILSFEKDNIYNINCKYTDMAGNTANDGLNKEFTIDTVAPMIAINGVTDGSSNAGDINPVVTVLDFNIDADASVVTVTTGKGIKTDIAIDVKIIEDGTGIGYRYSLNDMNNKQDDIYYLDVTAIDKAGNTSTLQYRFSLNRNGSNYDLTGVMKVMEKKYNTYAVFEDIQVIEMNVDKVEEFEVYISRNGELGYKAEYDRNVTGSADSGYIYTYNIKRENFKEEGSYRLSFYSRDKAGNEVNRTTDINGNDITFFVDNSVPQVIIDGVQTGMVYDVETQNVSIVVTDNIKLYEAEFILINNKNEVLQSWDYMENKGEVMHISIPEYDEQLSLTYRIKDAAGNEMQTFQNKEKSPINFIVSTDKLVQLINNPAKTESGNIMPLIIIICVLLTLASIITIVIYAKRKD